jgi:hypothetical protein
MLTMYVTRQTTQATYHTGPAEPYLDAFTHWLRRRWYRHETIRRRLPGAAQFVTWAQTTGCPLLSLSPATLEHFRRHLGLTPASALSGAISTAGPVQMKANSSFSFIVERDSLVQRQ